MFKDLIFIDVDGVLAVPNFGDYGVGMSDTEWLDFCVSKKDKAYENCGRLKSIVSYLIGANANHSQIYVLTTVGNSYEANAKRSFINSNYRNILFKEFVAVGSSEDKIAMIQSIARDVGKLLKDCLLIDDDFNLLLKAKESGINILHISNIVE